MYRFAHIPGKAFNLLTKVNPPAHQQPLYEFKCRTKKFSDIDSLKMALLQARLLSGDTGIPSVVPTFA